MSRPETTADPESLRRVGAPWRAAGVAVVLVAALIIVVGRAQNFGLHAPLMIAGFAILALGWVLAFVGVLLRLRQARR